MYIYNIGFIVYHSLIILDHNNDRYSNNGIGNLKKIGN